MRFRGRRRDDLNREIQSHLDLEIEERLARGETPEQARDGAIHAFGNATLVVERARDQWTSRAIDACWQDLRFGLRQISRAPGVFAAAVLTLALGLGANTALFSVINGFVRPLPVAQPDRLVVLAATMPGDETGLRYQFSFPAMEAYRAHRDVFASVFGFWVQIGGLRAGGSSTQFVYQQVTGNFFSGLGLEPAAGRLFAPGEGERAHAESEIVLGYRYWKSRFGGRQDAIGSTVFLDGVPTRIIGVAPEGFRGVFEGADMDGYVPMGAGRDIAGAGQSYFTSREWRGLTLVARLQPHVTLDEARRAADGIAAQQARMYPASDGGMGVRVWPEPLARPVPLPFLATLQPTIRWLLLTLATLVLLIACMNVANLLLVRATVRQREMAVRAALGAGRGRLVRLLLVESLLLALAGTAAGLIIGRAAADGFVRTIDVGMTDVKLSLDFSFDWRVFAYAFALAIGTGLIVGLLPALHASRTRLTDVLHDGSRGETAGAGRQRLRSGLVVAQIAGSFALLVIAGLFVRSLQQAQRIDLGFDPAHVLTARLDTREAGYDAARTKTYYDEVTRGIEGMSHVEAVAVSWNVPLGYIFGGYAIRPEEDAKDSRPRPPIGDNAVSPNYFETLRIPIVRGRAFTSRDSADAPRVAIVNETMAARYWPDRDPIGKRFEIDELPGPLWQVVGVAHDSKYLAVFESPLPFFYLPEAQNPSSMRYLQIRSSAPLDALARDVTRQIASVDPDVPIADLKPMQALVSGGIGFLLFRAGALQATVMGALGLALAIIGIYAVVSYRTAQRAREIGIRVALGAQPGDVKRLVVGQGARLVLGGLAAGLVVAGGIAAALEPLLLRVPAIDPWTFAIVTVGLALVALVACYLPVRSALRGNPVAALRHE